MPKACQQPKGNNFIFFALDMRASLALWCAQVIERGIKMSVKAAWFAASFLLLMVAGVVAMVVYVIADLANL